MPSSRHPSIPSPEHHCRSCLQHFPSNLLRRKCYQSEHRLHGYVILSSTWISRPLIPLHRDQILQASHWLKTSYSHSLQRCYLHQRIPNHYHSSRWNIEMPGTRIPWSPFIQGNLHCLRTGSSQSTDGEEHNGERICRAGSRVGYPT